MPAADDLRREAEAADPPAPREPLSRLAVLQKNAALIVTALLFAAGSYALYRLLSPLDFREVLASLKATPGSTYVRAIAATAIGYAALVGYDWSALRYLGKRLPLPFVALGGFLGYAFGNTIGLSAVSGGAVRYRIYAALGLDAYDVAAISSFAAIAYGVGVTLIGLAALVLHPDALGMVLAMNPATVRVIALAALAASLVLLYGIALWGGTLRLGRFALRAPGAGDVTRQLVITMTDIGMAALTLYVLLPHGTIAFPNLLAVFAIATMAGVLSHVPGGVGVFESVVIAAIGGSVPLNDAVTALLLFRLIYFLLPFAVALATLSASEVWTATGRRTPAMTRLQPVMAAGRAVIPTATAMLVLLSGVYMMFAGVIPNGAAASEELQTFLPLAMIEGGALGSSIVGSLLIVLALGLLRRSRAAFWIVLGALLAGVVTTIVRGYDLDRLALLGFMAIVLYPCRREFYRAARLTQGLWSAQWALFVLATGGALVLTYLAVHRNAPYAAQEWWKFALDGDAARAQRAALAGCVILSVALLSSALRARQVVRREPDPEALAQARVLIDAHGAGSDMLAMTGDKTLMFAGTGDAVLSYGVKGASWIALGAPVGTAAGREDLAWAFHDAARAAGARPVFYEAPASFTDQAIEMGLALHKMGEEAVVPLTGFSLDGPARKRLRTGHARALRDGLALELSEPPHAAALVADLARVSRAWLGSRGAREKTFSVGRFDPVYLQRFPVAVVRCDGRAVAFANVLTASGRRSAAVDLMRHADDAPPGTMEFLFTALMLRLAETGAAEFSLGMAPFAGLPTRRGADLWSRFGTLVYRYGDRFYNFDGLRRFKDKFDPEWRPRYFCCRSIVTPVAPLADAARLIAGTAQGIAERGRTPPQP